MNFIDLPGIVSFPLLAKAYTTDLCEKYISDPNSFLLCVANATIPRLTAYEPLATIIRENACNRSIIVLTMADKLSSRDFPTHLLNRIMMTSDEFCNKNNPFIACCAVINRSYAGANKLIEQENIETNWFNENILLPIQNNGKSRKQALMDAELVQNHVGITRLLQVANTEYEKYIKEKWIPRTLCEVDKQIEEITYSLENLGIIVSQDNIHEFLNEFKSNYLQLIYQSLFNDIYFQDLFIDKHGYKFEIQDAIKNIQNKIK
jgi:hypothetical protein